jgi:(1->4)-alpha-D-glucan 1-alpha-D-glucosylmutase
MTTARPTRQSAALSDLLSRLPRRTPRATYRLQFHAGFTLDDGAAVVAYLNDLGISDLYASPILTARAGSTHGYDITDHGSINPDIGGEEAFDRLSNALQASGLGLMLDVVPNHMGIGDQRNGWWLDVLENGPSSIFAPFFDIDWAPISPQLRDKVLLPVLGDQYGQVLERGELQLRYNEGSFALAYWDNLFPIAPRSYSEVLSYRLEHLIDTLGPNDEHVVELQSILTAISYLPERTETAADKVEERNREKEVVKRRLKQLTDSSPAILAAIEQAVARYNGTVGDSRSFDLLDGLMAQQSYRLAFWRVAAEEINYRRFFDINDLAAIRVELPEVLQATHALILRLLAEGRASSLRIDHPDGLWDPARYFAQLQESYLESWAAANLPGEELEVTEARAGQVRAWISATLAEAKDADSASSWPLHVVAEKILSDGETLPDDWAVSGTTGYDFLNEVNGIFVDAASSRAFDRLYNDVAGRQPAFANLVNAKKKEIMLISLASEINTLSHLLDRLTEANRNYRDFTLNSLTFALREVIAALPVYRTYLTEPGAVAPWDQRFVEQAVREAKRRNPRTAEAIFDFLRDTLLLRNYESFVPEARDEVLRCVMKLQQLSGPVMAKGVEDTTFYVYNRLVSLNEVGGHPQHFGGSVENLHRRAAARSRRWPHTMLASSTHDTKRSEDVRARINVLSELPQEWRQAVNRWSRLNARKKTTAEDQTMPSRNDEYLLYQTLVGTWPILSADDGRPTTEGARPSAVAGGLSSDELAAFRERIAQYMEKATREAKVHTSWINPSAAYDTAMRRFVESILDPRRSKRFLDDLAAFSRRVAYFGRFNSLAQTLLKLTAPGVPDIYQGCELWDFSLVDPDNRRPVDYALRSQLLAGLRKRAAAGRSALAAELLEQIADEGSIKLYLTETSLALRQEQPGLFEEGAYLPLAAEGKRAAHAVAYARQDAAAEVIVVVPRLSLRLAGGELQPPLGELWDDTWIPLPHAQPDARYRDRLTGATLTVGAQEAMPCLKLSEVLAEFPVALLERI